ncbi:MAG TPA: hypothetical protein VMT20_24300 [Terriglobia bacterium]|nr:hypothetical protein [Terriglobia bacterium]
MGSSATSFARALLQETPQERLEKRIQKIRKQIEAELRDNGRYKLTDDEGRVFMIEKNGKQK